MQGQHCNTEEAMQACGLVKLSEVMGYEYDYYVDRDYKCLCVNVVVWRV